MCAFAFLSVLCVTLPLSCLFTFSLDSDGSLWCKPEAFVKGRECELRVVTFAFLKVEARVFFLLTCFFPFCDPLLAVRCLRCSILDLIFVVALLCHSDSKRVLRRTVPSSASTGHPALPFSQRSFAVTWTRRLSSATVISSIGGLSSRSTCHCRSLPVLCASRKRALSV